MGRQAIYSTEEARKEAKKEQAQERSMTEGGKELRSAQNRRAYQRRSDVATHAGVRLTYQRIPAFIAQLAEEPMAITSYSLFDEHYFSDEPITPNDGFEHWESPPPYFISKALTELGFDDTVDAVHGRRMRLQYNREKDLVERYSDRNRIEMWCEVHLNIFRLIQEAKALKDQLKEIKSVDEHCVHYVMGHHFLFWKAQAIKAYDKYWKLMRNGTAGDIQRHFEYVWYTPT